MIISDWLKNARERVNALDAELILTHVLKANDRTFLVTHNEDDLTDLQLEQASEMLERRANGEPMAYILGYREFYGRNFDVNNKVLIPRPETEEIINVVKELPLKNRVIWEIGTGSGCIAVTLKRELPDVNFVATDISDDALQVARKNAKWYAAEIDFLQADLINDALMKKAAPDVVVANLPYVDKNWNFLDFKTLNYEPSLALYAEDEGLALIYRLLQQINEKLDDVYVVLESDVCQQEHLSGFVKTLGMDVVKISGYITVLKK